MLKDRTTLLQYLGEQVYFIQDSIAKYDHGVKIEAKRIATHLRILLHNTKSSDALLFSLNDINKMYFLNIAHPYSEHNLLTHFGLLYTTVSPNGAEMKARLSKESANWVTFDNWWNEIVIRDYDKKTYTRKQVINQIANKDGGAHVDLHIQESLENLKNGKGSGWLFTSSSSKAEQSITSNVLFETLRAIAFEVLCSLKNKYPMLDITESDKG